MRTRTGRRLYVTPYSSRDGSPIRMPRDKIISFVQIITEWCVKDRDIPPGDTGDKNVLAHGFKTEADAAAWMERQ